MMSELAIALSEDEVYTIDLSDTEAPLLVSSIIENPGEMTTYNWKENARGYHAESKRPRQDAPPRDASPMQACVT